MCVCVFVCRQESPFGIRIPAHWKLIDCSINSPPVLSPISILPPPRLSAFSFLQGQIQRCFNIFFPGSFTFFKKFWNCLTWDFVDQWRGGSGFKDVWAASSSAGLPKHIQTHTVIILFIDGVRLCFLDLLSVIVFIVCVGSSGKRLWWYALSWCHNSTEFVMSFTVVVLTCPVVCGCVYVWGVLVTCILVFAVLCVLFRLCIFILICFVCTSVRTTATEWQLNCS